MRRRYARAFAGWWSAACCGGVGIGCSAILGVTGEYREGDAGLEGGRGVEASAACPSDVGAGVDNVMSIVASSGPPANPVAYDRAFAKVTLCVPGTATCTTVDYMLVSTEFAGLRVLASAVPAPFHLPQKQVAGGSLAECAQFTGGYSWGSVRLADIHLAGEVARNVPIDLMGDPALAPAPSACVSGSPIAEATLGANGILGLAPQIADCGPQCSDASHPPPDAYYRCTGTTSCSPAGVPVDAQIANPVASFAADNNGFLVRFPATPPAGADTLSGTLVFGIGTQPNNAVCRATVMTLDSAGYFTTRLGSRLYRTSVLDLGSNTLAFDDTSIPSCLEGFYCPTAPLALSAVNEGANGARETVSFGVESAKTLFQDPARTAFDDLASVGIDGTTFDWGFPFFVGRTVFFALDGAKTPVGSGPFVAY